MGLIFGVMIAIMIVGFIGFGHNKPMMSGHEKDDKQHEITVERDGKKNSCTECPEAEKKNGGQLESKDKNQEEK